MILAYVMGLWLSVAPSGAAVEAEPAAFDRHGALLSAGAGVTHCAQEWCSDSVIAGMARLEVGQRFGWIAPLAYVHGGGALLDPPEGSPDGSMTLLGAGVAARVFPNPRGRIDPYLGFGLGYSRIAKKVGGGFPNEDVLERGAALFTAGLSVYVHRHLAVGPRFDYTLPFAGKLCSKDDFGEGCTKAKDISESSDDATERAIRRRWPHPWSFTLDLMVVF